MKISTGIDLVHIPTFTQTLHRSGASFLETVFLPEELDRQNPDHLAGVFAAKEATLKALSQVITLSLKDIRLHTPVNQKPTIILANPPTHVTQLDLDVSISHEQEYAIAVVVALINFQNS
jgi:phosphopantetheine--protein transferase-like protein